MNMNSVLRDPAQGWDTFCGSGGGSDCIAYRTVPNPRYGQPDPETGKPEPEHLIELGSTEGRGGTGTFTVAPHELDQLVAGYLRGAVTDDVRAAVRADMKAHPELVPATVLTAGR
jgi:hypothetical protein